uniref:Uncharacterized protein n=1 Tax=Anguilla anguilla TaxID=7936 RepID=A0A0E9QQ98_ANGAN
MYTLSLSKGHPPYQLSLGIKKFRISILFALLSKHCSSARIAATLFRITHCDV